MEGMDQPTPAEGPGPSSREGWRTRASLGIGFASFLADAGHEVPTSLLPGFLTSTLGAPAAALGLIEGISDALAGAARLAGGALADNPRVRRRTAAGGYTATAILSAAIGAATNVVQVGLLRAGAWTARGLRVPSRNALLADAVSPQYYGRAFGVERAMDNLGAIVGPLLALGLVSLVGVRTAILLSVLPGLLSAAAILYVVRNLPRVQARRRDSIRLRVGPVLDSPVRQLLPGLALFELGNLATPLLILRATEVLAPERGVEAATTAAIVLYALHNLAATLASFPAGRATDRHGSVVVLSGGVALFGLSYAGFAFTGPSLLLLACAFVGAGAAIGCVETAEHTAVATHAPEAVRGSAFGLLAAVQSFGNLVASGVAGLLWTFISPSAAFSFATLLMLLSGLGLARAWRTPTQAGRGR